jgi:hypothetical protein
VAVLALLLVVRVGSHLFGGGGEETAPPGVSGATGVTGAVDEFAPPAPAGSRSATFPIAVAGTRLEVKVIALGDHPDACTAEGLLLQGDVRTVYHHLCRGVDGGDRYFFAVRLTNRTDAIVPVRLDAFAVADGSGEPRTPFAAPPLGSAEERFFPVSTELGPGASLKRWLTVDGKDGFTPLALTYHDGKETLTVRFQGDWAK